MQNQQVGSTGNPVQVRQISAVTANWIHVLGSDRSHYLLPAVPQSYSHEHAYADSVILKFLNIPTLDAAVLVFTNDLVLEAGLAANENPRSTHTTFIGWRLPQETANCKLMQILPSSWLSRIANRERFLEVLLLDSWIRRSARREAIFQIKGQVIEALFLPSSGSSTTSSLAATGQFGYYQKDIYKELNWVKIQSGLKAKLASFSLASLEQSMEDLPQIGASSEVLRAIWSEFMVNRVSFDQTLADVRARLFGGTGYTNAEGAVQVCTDRVCFHRGTGARPALGSSCG